MKSTACTDPTLASRPIFERRAAFELRRVAAEQLATRVEGDRFVRGALSVDDLSLRIEGPGFTPARPCQAVRTGVGFAAGLSGGDVAACQRACLADVERLTRALAQLKGDYRAWREENPGVREPGNGARSLGDLLDDDTLSTGELCVHIVEVILHERPEAAFELKAGIPDNELPGQRPSAGGPPPNTELSRGIFSALGMGASMLGGLLQSPLAVPLLTAACAAIPGLQPLAVAIPFIAPIAGMALGGVGGMASQVGQGQAPSLDPASLASPDMLSSLLPAISGMLGGVAGVPAGGAPVAPVPAA